MKSLEGVELPETFDELVDCVRNRHNSRKIAEKSLKNRRIFADKAEKFHVDSDTLTSPVKKSIETLESEKECIFLFSSHQPNFMPYSGVVRKLTLMEAVRVRLETVCSTPVISLLSISDKALPDRWVKNAQLPDIRMSEGYVNISNPEIQKKHHNRLTGYGKYTTRISSIPKPSPEVLSTWKDTIKSWIDGTLTLTKKLAHKNGFEIPMEQINVLFENTREIMQIIDESYEQARNYADLNAFLLSKIVNRSFGYSTILVRYSELMEILKDEISLLSCNYERYFEALKEAFVKTKNFVPDLELAPFWYHCECGGMANLTFQNLESVNLYMGDCTNCQRNYKIDIKEITSEKSNFFSNISLRAIPFLVVYLKGLEPDLYVGGTGGLTEYYPQAKIVAEKLGTEWPVIGVWNPHDRYAGIGQLHAFLASKEENPLKVKQRIHKVFEDKYSIVDYAVNIGLGETSQQWLNWLLNKNGNSNLTSDVYMDSVFAGKFEQEFLEFVKNDLSTFLTSKSDLSKKNGDLYCLES
jgi:hypothetical protein